MRGPARLVRGAVLGVSCLLLSLAAHTAAGGASLDLGLGLSALIALALGIAWAERRATPLRLAAFVLIAQLVLHGFGVVAGSHHHGASLIPSPGMIAAHAIAAVGMALLLAHADTLAHGWVAFLQSLRTQLPVLQPLPVRVAAAVAAGPVPAVIRPVALHDIARRGPPVSE